MTTNPALTVDFVGQKNVQLFAKAFFKMVILQFFFKFFLASRKNLAYSQTLLSLNLKTDFFKDGFVFQRQINVFPHGCFAEKARAESMAGDLL